MLHGEPGAGVVYGLSAFQGDFTESSSDNTLGAQYAARAAVNFGQLIARPNTVLHVGVARTGGSSQLVPTTSGNTVDAPSTTTRGTIVAMRSEARGMSNIYRAQIGGDKIDTAAYGATANNAVTVNRTMDGIELALAHGPFKIQAENFDSKYSASAKTYNYVTGATSCVTAACVATQDVRVQAKYVEALYNITGEDFAKSYKSGAFGGITPSSVFMKDYGGVVGNGTGAWQVGVRVSEYTAAGSNSVDGAVTGNRTQNATGAQTVTYGVNWILNSNARIMANYATTKFDTAIAPLDTTDMGTTTKENVFSVRTQINF
jgi:phosphate-selective porin OprO/OprP